MNIGAIKLKLSDELIYFDNQTGLITDSDGKDWGAGSIFELLERHGLCREVSTLGNPINFVQSSQLSSHEQMMLVLSQMLDQLKDINNHLAHIVTLSPNHYNFSSPAYG